MLKTPTTVIVVSALSLAACAVQTPDAETESVTSSNKAIIRRTAGGGFELPTTAGTALCVQAGGSTPGSSVVGAPCTGSGYDSQAFIASGNEIQLFGTNLCITVENLATGALGLETCVPGHYDQMWTFVYGFLHTFSNADDCLGLSPAACTKGVGCTANAPIVISKCYPEGIDTVFQSVWPYGFANTQIESLIAYDSQALCMDIYGNNDVANGTLDNYYCQAGNRAQGFTLGLNNTIMPSENASLCVTAAGAAPSLQPCLANDFSQQWAYNVEFSYGSDPTEPTGSTIDLQSYAFSATGGIQCIRPSGPNPSMALDLSGSCVGYNVYNVWNMSVPGLEPR